MLPPPQIQMSTYPQGQPGVYPPANQQQAQLGYIFQNNAITVQQTMRGCFQELCGCDAKSEYRVYPGHIEQGQARDENISQIGHLLEESSCLLRFCCASSRGFKMPLTLGAPDANGNRGPTIVEYQKDFSFPTFCVINSDNGAIDFPCCCCLPTIRTVAPDGKLLGKAKYHCDMCPWVPKYKIFNSADEYAYLIQPETCCFGACILCRLGGFNKGSKSVYVPFLIRDPTTTDAKPSLVGGQPAMINKVWSGMKKECCSDADNFQVVFPSDASMEMKAVLLGANMLIDFTYFETHK